MSVDGGPVSTFDIASSPSIPNRQCLDHHQLSCSPELLLRNIPKDSFIETVSSEPQTLQVPVARLAEQFGVNQRTVRRWLKEFSSQKKTCRDHFVRAVSSEPQILQLPVATLAEQFGVTRQTIQRWLKEYPSVTVLSLRPYMSQ